MKLHFFCPRWGSEDLSWDEFIKKAKNVGYNGIEYGISSSTTVGELEVIWDKLEKHNLSIIPQHYETNYKDFNQHYDAYALWLQKLESFSAIKLNSQTGKDYFSFEQNKALIDLAQNFANKTGISVFHETHRGKFSFAAHVTHDYLQKIPYLKLTFDASHWVNVAESYLEDQDEVLTLAIARTGHLHGRVGYPEGPQITDPRSSQWQYAISRHLSWWKKIANENTGILTVTPEFGPYPYMVHHPLNNQPIASQWDINVYMMELIRNKIND
jgi:sugar phosphate isomerase/epimerase